MINEVTVCFGSDGLETFGEVYRPGSQRALQLEKELRKAIQASIGEGFCYFILDMSFGICIPAGEILLQLQRDNTQMMLEAAIPSDQRVSGWTLQEKRRYYDILAACDLVHYVQRKSRFSAGINTYMVEHARRIITVDGGDYVLSATLRYARERGLEMMHLPFSAAQ